MPIMECVSATKEGVVINSDVRFTFTGCYGRYSMSFLGREGDYEVGKRYIVRVEPENAESEEARTLAATIRALQAKEAEFQAKYVALTGRRFY